MRNKTISKILIAAGLVTVVGAVVYGTSHNTNNKVAANNAIAQEKNPFKGLMMSLNQNEDEKVAADKNADNNNSVVRNGVGLGQAVNAEDNNILEENIFSSDNNAVEENTAARNLVKDDKTSLMNKLNLTSTVKRPSSFKWLSFNQNTVKPNKNNQCNNGTSSGSNSNNTGSNSGSNAGQITPDKNENNNNAGNENNNSSSNNGSVNNGNKPNNNNGTQNKPVESTDSFIAEIEQQIFQSVNAERAKAGLSALSYNNTMQKYARIKSKDMGDRGYFDHKNPEGQLITAQMQKDGVKYNAWGENIAYISGMSGNSAIANKFMTNWMNSDGHRANILSTNFSSIGIGVYKIGNKYYATQEFYR